MSKNNKKVLIVEDEVAMLTALAKKFSSSGFVVFKAENGEEGLKTFLEKKPDLVMLDIIMPKMDGLEVIKKIREDKKRGADVPIIMLTNLSDAEQVAEAGRFGVFDFLVKTDWRLDDIVDLANKKLSLK